MAPVFDAVEYDAWYDTPKGRALFGMEVAAIRRLMSDLRRPFLEIGVGTGRFAAELRIDVGADPCKEALTIAERRGITVKKAKGEELPFENGSFGAVFIILTLCFVNDPRQVLSEARRVLQKRGDLIIGLINKESQWGKFYQTKKDEGHPVYRHARFFNIKEIAAMLKGRGMTVVAYTSTLCQPLSDTPYEEAVHNRFVEGAGFIGIRAGKFDAQGVNGD